MEIVWEGENGVHNELSRRGAKTISFLSPSQIAAFKTLFLATTF
jgi:hypothetical protein